MSTFPMVCICVDIGRARQHRPLQRGAATATLPGVTGQ